MWKSHQCIWLFTGSPCFTIGKQSRNVLDLIQFQNTSTKTMGLSYISGPNNATPAILLEDSSRNLELPDPVSTEALQMMKDSSEITFLVTLKQELGNSGSLISFASDVLRFLELESSGRRDEVRFHYTHDQQIHTITFPYRLADNQWHKVALSLSGTHLTLFVNCSKIYERVIQTVDRDPISGSSVKLYIGQRNAQHAKFRGGLQDVQIVTQSHGYLLQCPLQDAPCPTCGQFQSLEQQMKLLYSSQESLSKKLQQAENRISALEQCECRKSCYQNGTSYKEGEVWHKDQCTVCGCRDGRVDCHPVDCPPAECDHPIYRDRECCPVCLTNCFYSGKYFNHGESFSPRVCVTCTCDDGRMECKRLDPEENCPNLNCPEEKRLHIQGECCPVCEGTDFCGQGHDCHDNATCLNLATRYMCQCDIGFRGDGINCEDIDECLTKGGKFGHHCNGNTRCVNTVGSYMCKCASGYTPDNPYSCTEEELNECLPGSHTCHKDAECLNQEGRYSCMCKHGYTGDGHTCTPMCTGVCLNGGKCVAPNVCECRHGYIGLNCELADIDECAIGISACHGNSVCINTPGWYRCDCIEGYHSNWPDNHYGSLCLDINECRGEGKGHTCHSSNKCVNTEGSYECHCQPGMPCVRDCWHDGSNHGDSSVWTLEDDKCIQCQCQEGVATCHKKECDCEGEGVDMECCPHCDESSQCNHQEVPLTLKNGEQWVYQCQTCECLNGEIDCWPLECPRTKCSTSIQEPGDCCPRCVEENPCTNPNLDAGGADNSAVTCLYQGHTYAHGDNWKLHSDPCTLCECKVGHICCLFNQTCTSLPSQENGIFLPSNQQGG
ncbi:hypothetical protein FSP39_020373 [Pinctada imbricata]|uniref:Neural EGFL like 2 n=1 Tax=Pinctada imbricata TaxID=66713 RepID=A0AA88Y664_PINIB|nr:hypothetical protein FSP39_020373 [Pinctada imbricata]